MERMAWNKKSNEPAGGSAEKSRRSGGDAVEFLKASEYSISKQELELQFKERSRKRDPDDKSYRLNPKRNQIEQQMQISQALMTMMQNLVKK